jgi:hypothetical protein
MRGVIDCFAISRCVEWEVWNNDFNLAYIPMNYPIFSKLWCYCVIGKDNTNNILNGITLTDKTEGDKIEE